MCHDDKRLPIVVHCYIELDRAAADLAILDVTLVRDRAVDKNINRLAAIGAMDFSCLNLVHKITNSPGLHTELRQSGKDLIFRH